MPLAKLNKSHVDKLPFTEKVGDQVLYYDTELKGFGLRVGSKTKSYFAETKVQGKTVRGVIQQAAALGIPVEFTGSGVARLQAPQPGSILPLGSWVRVQFGR